MRDKDSRATAVSGVYYPRVIEALIRLLWFRPRIPPGKARRLGLIEQL